MAQVQSLVGELRSCELLVEGREGREGGKGGKRGREGREGRETQEGGDMGIHVYV